MPSSACGAGVVTRVPVGSATSVVAGVAQAARAIVIVGTKVPALPTGSEVEVARSSPTATASVAAATDAVPIPSWGPVEVPATSSFLLEEGARVPTGVVVGAPSPASTSSVARRGGAEETMTTLAPTRTGAAGAYATVSAAGLVQRAEQLA